MRIKVHDVVGLALMLGTAALVVLHVLPGDHAQRHREPDAGASVTRPVRPSHLHALVDVNVLPMDTERVLRHQVVLVEDGVIRRVGTVGSVTIPEGTPHTDGRGALWVAPGLTDAHVHLRSHPDEWMDLFLANGVTTVFNLRGEATVLELRERIRRGDLEGPTLYTSGPFTNEPAVRTPQDAVEAVRRQKAEGYDFVKVHGNLTRATYEALVEEGRRQGIPVLGHAPRNLPFDVVLEGRPADVVHAEELIYTQFPTLDVDAIGPVAQRMARSGVWLTPTLTTFAAIVRQWGLPEAVEEGLRSPQRRFLPASLAEAWRTENTYTGRDAAGRERIEEMYRFQIELVRRLHRAGVPMLAGTDTPVPLLYPGFSLHDELDALVAAGFTPFEALATATRNPGRFIAEFVRASDRFGTVTEGARADLVLLDGNPLENLALLRHPAGVMLRGKWLSRSDLTAMRDELVKRSGLAQDGF